MQPTRLSGSLYKIERPTIEVVQSEEWKNNEVLQLEIDEGKWPIMMTSHV